MRSLYCACALLVLLCILPMLLGRVTNVPGCEGCGGQCDKCKYGSGYVEYCNKIVCLKGPDEDCGSSQNIYGKCGEGMFCKCNKCAGCSVDTLECAKLNACHDHLRPRKYYGFH